MKGSSFGGFYNFQEKTITSASELIKTSGALVFTREQIFEVSDPLTRLFRIILYKEKIRYPFFASKVKEYYRDVLGESEYGAQNQYTNLKKTIYRDNLSILKFKIYLACIGISINSISCQLVIDGEIKNYSSVIVEDDDGGFS